MDLKNGIRILKENVTLRRILEILLAVGNYLNGVEVNSFHPHPSSETIFSIDFLVCWFSTRLSFESSRSERYWSEAFITLSCVQYCGGKISRYK